MGSDGTAAVRARSEVRPLLERQLAALMELARSRRFLGDDLAGDFAAISETAGRAIGVARTGVWLLDESREQLRCVDLFELPSGLHSRGPTLHRADYPAYFAGLGKRSMVVAHDALTDPETREYAAAYLVPNRIASTLDATVRLRGQLVGVLCLEEVGAARRWSEEEQVFARAVGDLVSLAVESAERYRSEQAERALARRLEQVGRFEQLGRVAGGIAHDFNHFLGVILGNLDLLRDAAPRELAQRAEFEAAIAATLHARDVVRQLLVFGRGERPPLVPLDLRDVIAEALSYLSAIRPQGVLLEGARAEAPLPVMGDATQLLQVLVNLCTNAFHAVSDGGCVRITAREVTVDAATARLHPPLAAGAALLLEVRDDGRGMDEATLARVFEPFFSTKPAGRGVGLGLAVVHGVVQHHGGAIVVESAPGAGTTMRIWLPRCTQLLPAAKQLTPEPLPRGRGERLLVVDDQVAIADLARSQLPRLGYRAEVFTDPVRALAALESRPAEFDAVITDLSMPTMNGLDLAARVRALRADLPIVLMSGFDSDPSAAERPGSPIAAVLPKPFDLTTLATTLAAVLAKRGR
jgi:signal transduction histidine kinase/CheY-like chemotaxis protein